MFSENPKQRILDIIGHIDLIEEFTNGFSGNSVINDRKIELAVKMALMNIGEAGKKLGSMAEELMPDQPWHKIYGFCNRLRHEYDIVDIGMVCNIVEARLTSMKQDCMLAIQKLENSHIKSADVKPSN